MKLLKQSMQFLKLIQSQGFASATRFTIMRFRKIGGNTPDQSLMMNQFSISILVTIEDMPPPDFVEFVESIILQSNYNWELCICDNGSANDSIKVALNNFKDLEPRIKVLRVSQRVSKTEAINSLMEFSTGEFITVIEHNKPLKINALESIANLVGLHPEADLIYSDVCKCSNHTDAMLELVTIEIHAIRKKLFLKLSGFREEYGLSSAGDFVTRASAISKSIVCIPAPFQNAHQILN